MPLTTTFAGASARSLGLFRLSAGGPVGVFDLVTPTSVDVAGTGSSASIGNGGSVEFSTAESLSLNGVFSADYDNYHIVLNHVSSTSTGNTLARLRVSGSDATATADYNTQQGYGVLSTLFASRTTTDGYWTIDGGGTVRNIAIMQIFSPFEATPTAATVESGGSDSTVSYWSTWLTHELSTSYDGITIYPGSGTISGTVAVYGLGI